MTRLRTPKRQVTVGGSAVTFPSHGRVFRAHLADVEARHGAGPIDAELDQLFNAGLVARSDVRNHQYTAVHKGGTLSASAARKCPRRNWLSANGTKETNPPNPESLARFHFGHCIEEAVAEALEAAGGNVLRQLTVLNDTGHSDIFVVSLGRLVEVKCTSAENVEYHLVQGTHGSEEHRAQLNLYLHATQLGQLEGVTEPLNSGALVYCVPNGKTGERVFWPWTVYYDEAAALLDLADLQAVLDAKVMPDIPEGYVPGKYPCSFCPFLSGCWEMGLALNELKR